jgi:TonB family protein
MSEAILYRPPPRWQTWTALACAVAIHIGAASIRAGRSEPVTLIDVEDWGPVVSVMDNQSESPAEPDITPSVAPPENPFRDEISSQAQTRRRNKAVAPISMRAGISSGTPGSFRSMDMLSAPKPQYPYEARSRRVTGSGIAILAVDQQFGIVTDARMSESTGSIILDEATISAMRRWRFKPDIAARMVKVPITFRLDGIVY